jgi:hypothetical protein
VNNPHTGKIRPTGRNFRGLPEQDQQLGIHVGVPEPGAGKVELVISTGKFTARSLITCDVARQIVGMLERAIDMAEPPMTGEFDDLLLEAIAKLHE